jgi:hypothetical protein
MAGGLGSIANTLHGLDPLTLAQALADQQAQELAANTQQATQAASQAGQQYQQAAQAPAPEPNIFEQLIPALFGNVASVLSQNPMYQQQGQEQVQMSRTELLRSRAENLAGLMNTAKARAEAAQKAGDFEMESKARTTLDKIHQTYDQVKQNADHAFDAEQKQKDREQRMAEQRLQNQGAANVARINAGAKMAGGADMDFLQNNIITTAGGVRILDSSGMTPTDRTKAMRWAADNGVRFGNDKTIDKLHSVQGARTNLQAMLNQAAEILPATPAERILKAPGIAGSIAFQNNPVRSAWKTWRIQAIKQLTAIAGGMGSGMRINQAEIMQAVKNDIPTEYDTLPVAVQKINNVMAMLDRNEDPYLSQDFRATPRVNILQPQRAKGDALKAARTGDIETFRSIIQANRALNDDPEIIAQAKRLAGKR